MILSIYIFVYVRSTFDEDRVPALWEDESIRQDIHSVASLLKLYFRELPNPLCTYQLYDSFVNAVQSIPEKTTDIRLQLMRETVQKLPPPHFRQVYNLKNFKCMHNSILVFDLFILLL